MIAQGSGGGYGDVLERDPASVVKDLEDDLISEETARDIYHVVFDPNLMVVDEAATEAARLAEREARKARGVPFDEFVEQWTTAVPPENLPWYGAWGDRDVIYAGGRDVHTRADAIVPVFMPDPRDVQIAALEARLAAVEAGAPETETA